MKTNKIIVSGIVATGLLASSVLGVSAMQGEGKGNGQGQQKGKMEQQASMEKTSHNPADTISNIPAGELNETELTNLLYSYSEETLAHYMYMYFYELYGTNTFLNIANSEAEHKMAVQALLDRYGVALPEGYGELEDEFAEMKAKGELSLKDALEVGISIEMLDIEDIADIIINTDNDDIKAMYVNIGGASYNHLRGFSSNLIKNGFETELDYNQYLTDDEINDKNIVIKQKMAEKVIAEGVVLPEGFSPEDIIAKCEKENASKSEKGKGKFQGKGKSEEMNKGKQGQYQSFVNSNVNSTLKAKYKETYLEKYGATISKMENESLITFIAKVDDILEKVNSGDFSDETKVKYNSMLIALREIAVENLDETESLDLDIESLFN